jgi:hypothetical protein
VAFLDTSANPRTDNLLNWTAGAPRPVDRMWVLYRKSDAGATGPAVYYKTMRLMVRLPRGVIRDASASGYTIGTHVRIAGARGPVEVDWVRGRLYFTEVDEGNDIDVEFDYGRDSSGAVQTVPAHHVAREDGHVGHGEDRQDGEQDGEGLEHSQLHYRPAPGGANGARVQPGRAQTADAFCHDTRKSCSGSPSNPARWRSAGCRRTRTSLRRTRRGTHAPHATARRGWLMPTS